MQDLQQTIQLVLDYIHGVWIRKRYFLISSWLICPVGFVLVANMPNEYESEAQVYVDTRSMLAPLLKGLSVMQDPNAEVQMMAQTLKSRSNIETIARETDLDISATTDIAYEELIDDLTTDIKLSGTRRSNIYTIAYASDRPEIARSVVQETLDLFVEGALGGNRVESDNAARFLDEQIAEYEARLTEAEQRRANFQRQHIDLLPQSGSFHQNLASNKEQLEQIQLSIKETEQQIQSLNSRLSSKIVKTDSFSVRGGDEPALITTRFDDRIRDLEGKLDELKLRYTDKHPDVIEASTLLDSLITAREREIQAFLDQDASSESSPILNELNQEITLEISRLESQIASLKVREDSFINKIEDLQSKIDLVPQVEAEGIALNRDYNIIKQNYEELLARKEAADITERASITAEDLQFRIIQPPRVPQEPTGPNRFLFYTAVLLVGFGSGMGIAFLISQLNPILVRGQQLVAMTGFPILGPVTHLDVKRIKRNRRIKMLVFSASSGAILFMYSVLVAADYLHINLLEKVM